MNTLVSDILTSLSTIRLTTLPIVTPTYTSLKLPAVCTDDSDRMSIEHTSCELTVVLEFVTKSLSTAACSIDESMCSSKTPQSPHTPRQAAAATSKPRRTLMKVHEAIRIETSADEAPWARNKKYIVKLGKGYLCNVCNKVSAVRLYYSCSTLITGLWPLQQRQLSCHHLSSQRADQLRR